MADEADKADASAEKAYATAVEAVPVKPETPEAKPEVKEAAAEPAPATKASAPPTAKPATRPAVVSKAKPAPAKKKPAPKKKAPTVKAKPVAAKPAPRKVRAAPKSPPKKQVTQVKEPIMAKTADFTKTVTDAVTEMQSKAKEAYDKSSAMAGEATEFTKGNVEALVESGKILSESMQEFGKSYVEEAKAAFETMTADMKEFAAIKSPTELFQLQGKLMRRNFDSMVAFGSKSSEAMVKLSNDAMAPISTRMSLAAEKISKAA